MNSPSNKRRKQRIAEALIHRNWWAVTKYEGRTALPKRWSPRSVQRHNRYRFR